jgi:hypothetical protein
MLRDRSELIAMHGTVGHDIVDAMMAELANAAERLKEIVKMVDSAYARVLVSAAAADAKGVKFKGVPKR